MRTTGNTIRIFGFLAGIGLVAAIGYGQVTAGLFTTFPSDDVDDGRFLTSVSGLEGLTGETTSVGLSVPAGSSQFIFRIFDGDTGEDCVPDGVSCFAGWEGLGHWDEGTTPLCATMYADPIRIRNTDPADEVATWCSNGPVETVSTVMVPDPNNPGAFIPLWTAGPVMPDNDWWTLNMNVTPAAVGQGGDAFYHIVLGLGAPDDGETVSNFKVAANVPLSVFSANFGFEAGLGGFVNDFPIIYPGFTFGSLSDPNYFLTAPTTYDGSYVFFLDVPNQLETITIWDGDFDHGTDPTKLAGSPSGQPFPACFDDDDANSVGLPTFAVGSPAANAESATPQGEPSDDQVNDFIRRSPCVWYQVTDPLGNVYRNMNPSGNREWEKFVITIKDWGETTGDPTQDAGEGADYSPIFAADGSTFVDPSSLPGGFLPTGLWKIEVFGLDLSNSNFWRFDLSVCGVVDGQPICPEEPVKIGDRVWYDYDGDGRQDVGEPGIPGVKVNRVGSSDMAATATDGIYMFDVLPGTDVNPAVYTVEVAPENLAAVPTGAVGDRVWFDLNNNGVDDGEPGAANVTVRLLSCPLGVPGASLAFTTTNDNGNYWFSGLPAGEYCTEVDESTLPSGFAQTNGAGGLSSPATIVSTEVFRDLDFGYYMGIPGVGALGDRVWMDLDSDGVQDTGEPGIDGVTMGLYLCGDNPSVDPPTAIAKTDAGGFYYFSELPAACYVVAVDGTTLPPGLSITFDPEGAADGQAIYDLGPGEVHLDLDFGYVGPDTTGNRVDFCLADMVWFDADANGLFDGTDTPIAGVTVNIRTNGGEVATSTVSAADGSFQICGLAPKLYEIEITDLAGALSGLMGTTQGGIDGLMQVGIVDQDVVGQNFGYVNQGWLANCFWTTNPDPLDDVMSFTPTSITDDIPFVDDGTGLMVPQNNFLFDMGCQPQGSIGDRIWQDDNGDGVQDAGEPGIGGVTVELTDCSGQLLQSVVTSDGTQDVDGDGVVDPVGYYRFTGLLPDCYRVVVDPTTLPAGLAQTYDLDGQLDNQTQINLGINEDRDDADFGYRPVLCDLAITKTCRPILPPSGDLACTEKISAFTIRYTGPSLSGATVQIDPDSSPTVTYSGVDLTSGVTVLSLATENNYSIDAAPDNGDLGAKTKIFINGVMEEIHTSCSTPFVAGQPAPLNNPKGAPSPNWFVESLRDKGGYEASVPLPPDASDFCELPSADGTLCTKRPTSLSLEFNGGDCSQSSNNQPSDKWECSGDAGTGPVHIIARKDNDIYFEGDVDRGGVFELLASAVGRNDLDSEIRFDIYSGGSLVQEVYFHTSCSKPLAIGDRFGSLEVVAFQNSEQGLVQSGGEVEYLYFVENVGSVPATDVQVNDIPHGFIGSSQSLAPAESVTFSKTLFITENVTNTGIVTANSDGGMCSAEDIATVVVGDLLGSIGDRVWRDDDGDGAQDGGEPGVNGVTVILRDGSGGLVGTQVTAVDGIYTFNGLSADTYSVEIHPSTLPPGYSQTFDLDGILDGMTVVSLTAGENRTDVDFGYRPGDVVCEPGNVRDEFNTVSYSNNDGSKNWAGDWIEDDVAGPGPIDGRVRIQWSRLVLNDYPDTGTQPSAARQVDMSGAQSATMSFTWTTHRGVDNSDHIVLEMSSDGGATWSTLKDFTGFSGARTDVPESFDISRFISGQTQVRFRVKKYYGGTDENFKVNDLKVVWTCESGGCEPMGYADYFETASFSNNDGPHDFAGDWVEDDPESGGQGVSTGQVRVTSGALRLDDYPDTGGYPSAARMVDLTGKSSASLYFMFDTSSGVDSSDAIAVEISSDGGSNWTILEAITGLVGSNWGERDYDISAFISSQTMVRFRVKKYYGGKNEYFFVTDLEIAAECDVPPPPVPQDSCDDGKPWQLIFEYTGESCSASNNAQSKDECSGDPAGASPVSAVPKSTDKFSVDPTSESIAVGGYVTFSSSDGGKMTGDLEFSIRKGSYTKQTVKLHTSCSQPLNIGDQFGSMILRGFEAAP